MNATYALCVNPQGYEASLEVRKIYRVLPDPAAHREGLLRILDESGEDYLYPADLFVAVELPAEAEEAFRAPVTAG